MGDDVVVLANRPVEQFMENPLDENVLSVRRNILYAIGILLIVGLTQKLLIPGTGESLIFGARETIFLLPIIFCAWWYLFREIDEAKTESIDNWLSQHEQKYKLFQQESLFKVKSLKQDIQQNYNLRISKQRDSTKNSLRSQIRDLIKQYRKSEDLVAKLKLRRQKLEEKVGNIKLQNNSDDNSFDSSELFDELRKTKVQISSEKENQSTLKQQIKEDWVSKYRDDNHLRRAAKEEIDFDELFSDRVDELIKERTDPDNYIFDSETNLLLEIQNENQEYRSLKLKQDQILQNKADKRVRNIKFIFFLALIVFGLGHFSSIRGLDGVWKGYQCERYEYFPIITDHLPSFNDKEDEEFYCGGILEKKDIGKAIEGLATNLDISKLFKSESNSFPVSIHTDYSIPPTISDSNYTKEIYKELQTQRSLLYSLITKDEQINIHNDITSLDKGEAKYKTYFSSGIKDNGMLTLSYPAFVMGKTEFEPGGKEWIKNSISTITKALGACPGQSKWIHIVGYPDSTCFKSQDGLDCLDKEESNSKNIELANSRAEIIKDLFEQNTSDPNTDYTSKNWQENEYRLMMYRAGFVDRFTQATYEPAPAGLLNRRIDVHVMSAGQCNRKQLLDDILVVSLE